MITQPSFGFMSVRYVSNFCLLSCNAIVANYGSLVNAGPDHKLASIAYQYGDHAGCPNDLSDYARRRLGPLDALVELEELFTDVEFEKMQWYEK